MQKKREPIQSSQRKLFSNKKIRIISIVILIFIISGVMFSKFFFQPAEPAFSLKAAIVDQLGNEVPNSKFNETGVVANMLKSVGFTVYYYKSDAVNVAFYRELAKDNYGIIVLRVHSAMRIGEALVDFFTTERFGADKYGSELDDGLLTEGYYSWKPGESYFAITAKFIENLEGNFPKSIIIAMGCNSLNQTTTKMAEAFKKKGAVAYVGWTGLVDPSHTDEAALKLLQSFLLENRTLDESISILEPDQIYGSTMKWYPPSEGDLKLSDLVSEKKNVKAQIDVIILVPSSRLSQFAKLMQRISGYSVLTWSRTSLVR
jgi:hypothetical protein